YLAIEPSHPVCAGMTEMENILRLRWYRSGYQRTAAPPWFGPLGIALIVGVAYGLVAHLTLTLLCKPDWVAVVWPAAGIASGALIVLGPAGQVPTTLAIAGASAAASLLNARSLAAAVVFALCNGGGAVFLAWVVKKPLGGGLPLGFLGTVVGLVFPAAD